MKTLRMNNEPYINTYNIYGTTCSIASHDSRIWPWIYNNFIQIRYVPDWNSYFFDNHHLIFDTCPLYSKYRIPRSMLQMKWNSIKEFIIESIDLNLYVYLYIDRFHLSVSKSYKKNRNSLHEILIYGYDSDQEIFYVADNLLEGKYIRTECTYNEIELGYMGVYSDNDFFTSVTLLEKRDEDFTFRVKQVKDLLQNYLTSKETSDLAFKEERIFGFEAWKSFYTNLIANQVIDRRAFHFFWEHKKVMTDRVRYLIDNEYIHKNYVNEALYAEFKKLEKNALIIRNLALKYSVSKDDIHFSKLSNLTETTIEYEKSLVQSLILSFENLTERELS
ncbi:hypothetical protein DET54_11420 [Paenibacillus pabuli]|uniref:Butirosin biosynthesis protein H N-terminal domain-containing protein n=1 Tax=Paenibacillus pabuli TaxID=1472 RepID=A0ABX9BEQ8_9BACL|nr:hypothetical protein [Paenibacillus pabuli]RAI89552.1 hypothetical protein DET54_11420 [Paenibacillus pabuli]